MAVYTPVSEAELSEFLTKFDIGDLVSHQAISEGVENSNYLVKTTEKKFILTLYEKRVKKDDLPFFLNLMEHLAKHNIPCPRPVHSIDDKALHELNDRPAAFFTFLNGKSPRAVRNEHCAAVGGIMANMHNACTTFPGKRKNALAYSGWQELYESIADEVEEKHPEIHALVSDTLAELAEHWPKKLPSGVIHADLFPDNVFFDGDKLVGLLDFYFACQDFYIYDLAICINAWCFEAGHEFNITKARKLCNGYNKVRPLSEEEFDALPVIARGAALRFLLTRLYDEIHHDENNLVTPKSPKEYISKLEFHRSVKTAASYGL